MALCAAPLQQRREDDVVCCAVQDRHARDEDCESTSDESEDHDIVDYDLESEPEDLQWQLFVADGRRVERWADLEEDDRRRQEAENQEPNAPGNGASEDVADDSQEILSNGSGSHWRRRPQRSKGEAKKQAADAAETTDFRRPSKAGRGAASLKPKGAGKGYSRKFQCQFMIGIEDDTRFHVVKRIFGQGGEHLKRIVRQTKAKLRLRGRGSGFLEGEGDDKQESTDDLMMCISSEDEKGFESAKRLFSELLQSIHSSYRVFCAKSGLPEPTLVIKLHNGYREGSR